MISIKNMMHYLGKIISFTHLQIGIPIVIFVHLCT